MSQEERKVRRIRVVVDVTPELRRRVKLAAADRDVSVREYVVSILEGAVPELPEGKPRRGRVAKRGAVRLLERVREDIMQGRRFDDSTDLVEQARTERTAEL